MQFSEFINLRARKKWEIFGSLVWPPLLWRDCEALRQACLAEMTNKECSSQLDKPSLSWHLPKYRGNHPAVLAMQKFLRTHLANDLVGAYLHGSLADGQIVAYSDFDALAIVRSEVLLCKKRFRKTVQCLYQGCRIMHEFDPFQHHGWFVLGEWQLKEYSERAYPSVLFDEAKVLLGQQQITIVPGELCLQEWARQACCQISSALFAKTFAPPGNLQELKSFLSQLMLLPALYLQAHGKRVSKRESFALARKEFSSQQWQAIEEAGRLRLQWSYTLQPWQRKLSGLTHPLARSLWQRLAPKIPFSWLTPKFYSDTREFLYAVQQKLGV